MKHFGIVLLLTGIGISNLYAQKFIGGISAGLASSQIDGDGYMGFNKAGITGGGFVNSTFKSEWAWQFELLYVEKGSIKPIHPGKGDYSYRKIALRYIEIPLLIKYHLPLSFKDSLGKIKVNIIPFAGLSFGRLFYTREGDEYGDILILGPFHKNEYAFQGGIEYALTRKFSLNIRYSRSVWPVADEFILTRWGFFGGSYNTVLAFSLRYQFIKK